MYLVLFDKEYVSALGCRLGLWLISYLNTAIFGYIKFLDFSIADIHLLLFEILLCFAVEDELVTIILTKHKAIGIN